MRVALLGSLPPLRGLSSYCFELVKALVEFGKIEFISFSKMYPAQLYPGGDLQDDHTFPEIDHSNLKVRRSLHGTIPSVGFMRHFSPKVIYSMLSGGVCLWLPFMPPSVWDLSCVAGP